MSRGIVGNEGTTGHAPPVEWSKLLEEAVTRPGVISSAYSRFWNYSVGNQLLAWFQCLQRKLDLGPINTFLGWKECGRSVKKGEKALTLCMPVTVKRRPKREARVDPEETNGAGGDNRPTDTMTLFVYKPHWFVLCQTDGREYAPTSLPAWDEATALLALSVERVAFQHPDGNCQGYALDRTVAVSPIAFLPHRTLFHEMAHVVLRHTEEVRHMEDGEEQTSKSLREVEAECVALICCESLGLEGAQFSRGYIQHWLGIEKVAEKSAQRIFKAADQLLKAGYPQSPD